MTTELPLANANRIEALASRLDDLERATARLNLMVADLLRLWSLVLERPVPDDFGNMKHSRHDGTVHANFTDRSRSGRPQSTEALEHALNTVEKPR